VYVLPSSASRASSEARIPATASAPTASRSGGWASRDVVEWSQGLKILHHPLVGELTLRPEAVTFPGDPDQTMIVFLAEPGSPAQHALDLLEMS
jgi:hypothetical protein